MNDSKIQKIGMAWIVVKNLENAIRFYTEVVGLNLCEHNAEYGWAELEAEEGGARLGIAQENTHQDDQPGQNAVVGLSVADIVAAKTRLEQNNTHLVGDIMEVPGIVKLQTFTDPDGNKFQLAQDLS